MRTGRVDPRQLLKRWADIRGELTTELLDTLQPTIQLADFTTEIPFLTAIPVHFDVVKAAGGAGTWSGFVLYTVKAHCWVELEYIQNRSADANFRIACVTSAGELASGLAATTPLPRRLRGSSDLGGLGAIVANTGYANAGPTTQLYRLRQGELLRVGMAVGGGVPEGNDQGVISCFAETTNTAIALQVGVRLHLLESR